VCLVVLTVLLRCLFQKRKKFWKVSSPKRNAQNHGKHTKHTNAQSSGAFGAQHIRQLPILCFKMGRTQEDYKRRLLKALAPHSTTDGEDMLDEWKFATHFKSPLKLTCACGQYNCLNVATVFNPKTKSIFFPIGSTCINKFLPTKEAEKHKLEKKIHDKQEKAQKKKMEKEQAKQQVQPVASYACTVAGCPHQTSDGRHRYCAEHHKACVGRAKWFCPFNKHRGSTWSVVVANDKKYLTWLIHKSGMFDTSPTNKYHNSNRITRAYLENEHRAWNQA